MLRIARIVPTIQIASNQINYLYCIKKQMVFQVSSNTLRPFLHKRFDKIIKKQQNLHFAIDKSTIYSYHIFD